MSKAHDHSEELKKAHIAVTSARLATMELFENHDTPIDAQHVIDHLQKKLGIDRVTGFRILNSFTEKGLLRKVDFGDGKGRYELATEEDHHHLICENCGKIEAIPDTVIPEMEKKIEKTHNFLIKRHSLEFFGLCSDCQKKMKK